MKTSRLLLEEWRSEDWIELRPIATDVDVMRYIAEGKPWDDARIQAFVSRQILHAQTLGFCMWKLLHRSDRRLIGHCGIQPLGASGEIEIGWWLARDCWGKGLATEAARRVCDYAFETARLRRLVAIAYPENLPSIKIMRKLGMRDEGRRTGAELGLAYPEVQVVLYALERHKDTTDSNHPG